MGIARGSCGFLTGDGTQLSVTLGFKPKHVIFINVTDRDRYEWIDGMDANTTLKSVAAGTTTADTTGAIIAVEKGFTVPAAVNISGKKISWFAE